MSGQTLNSQGDSSSHSPQQFTPSSATNDPRSPTPSSATDDARSPTPSSATRDTRSPTPRSTPSIFNDLPSFNPDVPLPSVERESSLTPSTSTVETRSGSEIRRSLTPVFRFGTGSINTPFEGLTLSSRSPSEQAPTQAPEAPNNRAGSSSFSFTPSVRVTPDPSSNETLETINPSGAATPRHDSRSSTTGGLTDGIQAMNIEGGGGRPRSGSRRRSGSQVNQPPHVVSNEEPPEALFHAQGVQAAFADARSLAVDLEDALSGSDLHHEPESSIRRLHQQATELSNFQPPSTRTVGLVGDSGVGKSSLINSLLDAKSLARASNTDGVACTCVATEYHFHDRGDFIIEVEFFTADELEHQFAELLESYRQFHLRLYENDTSREDLEELEKRARLAEHTFQAAFRRHLTRNEQFLVDRTHGAVLEAMLAWADLSMRQFTGGQGTRSRETQGTAEECSTRLAELTSEINNTAEASVWPFISKIRVQLNAHILSKGLVIVDLPGLRDMNAARQNVTERYVRKCDEIFAVCRIDRAVSDPGVMDVFELARRANLSNVGIICTRSDDIKPEEAMRDWRQEGRAIRTKLNAIASIREEMTEVKDEIDVLELGSDIEDESNEEARQKLLNLHREHRKLTKTKNQREFGLKEYLINIRNRKVESELIASYERRIAGQNLRVFCVSNTVYWERRQEASGTYLPFLRLSGVLGLRKHCISLVAQSHLRAAKDYIKDSIPALLGSVELWIQSGAGNVTAERKEALRNTAAAIQDELRKLTAPLSEINKFARSAEERFSDQVAQQLRQHTREWSQAAEEASLEWEGWHPSTYAAFCRNYGDYITKAVGRRRNWNDEAMSAMAEHMRTHWEALEEDVEELVDSTLTLVQETFEDACELATTTLDSSQYSNDALETLTATLGHQQNLLYSDIEQLFESFQNDISRQLKSDAFSGIRSSIMGGLMEASYRACNLDSGSGVDRRRKAIIGNRFGDVTLFQEHRTQLKEKFTTVARAIQEAIREKVDTHLAVVENDLDTLRNENVALESERYPEFRQQLAAEVERIKEGLSDARRRVDEVLNRS